jgi:alkylated DNA repair dioxygenase AlkB
MAPERLQQVLVSEYDIGAPIGWHRDKAVFGVVVGISLLSPCTFRLRRRNGEKWERASIEAEPGSIYVLSGLARTVWEHSIPPVDRLRYSITFRELANAG